MKVIELLPEVAEVIFFGLSTAGLSLLSAYTETVALTSLQHGELSFGLWAGYMGLVMFLFAYFIATDEIAPRVTALS